MANSFIGKRCNSSLQTKLCNQNRSDMKRKYSGHLPPKQRNFSAPNFGLGARQLDKALINASLENLGGVKNNTHKARLAACRDFAKFIKEETNVKRLNLLTKNHVIQYAEDLRERFELGDNISSKTARDYLSHINVCLRQARGDNKITVLATKEMDFPPKNGIETIDRSTSKALHSQIVNQASRPVATVAQLQRNLGLRFREAALLDSQKALKEYQRAGGITIEKGTKGGQPRHIPIEYPDQIVALEEGAMLQMQTGHINATPSDTSLKAFQSHAWREVTAINSDYHSHGERKFFACQYYAQAVGVQSPVVSQIPHGKPHISYIAQRLDISFEEAKLLDNEVRYRLSELLGHHRPGICAAYIG